MKFIWILMLVGLIFSVVLITKTVWAKRSSPNAGTYADLRAMALTTTPEMLGLEDLSGPYGVVMEMDIDGETATIVTFVSGDASLYLSTGGGVIGGGGHEPVRQAVAEFVREAGQSRALLSSTDEFPRPSPEQTRFYVLTPDGPLTAERATDALGEQKDDLSPLFYAGQAVLTQLRLTA